MCVNTRFTAEATIIGNIAEACKELTAKVHALTKARKEQARKPKKGISRSREHLTQEQLKTMWDYMVHGSPNMIELEHTQRFGRSAHKRRPSTLPEIEAGLAKSLLEDTDALWDKIHKKKVRFCFWTRASFSATNTKFM